MADDILELFELVEDHESDKGVMGVDASQKFELEFQLNKVATSNVSDKQLAAEKFVDALKLIDDKEVLANYISSFCKLSEDDDGVVRGIIMECMPFIASLCKDHGPDLDFVIRQLLVPTTVKLIEDREFVVRIIARTSLLVLLKKNLIDNTLLSEWICPLIAQQATTPNILEERRTEAINLMCKMAPFIGKEMTIKCFLEPFTLCCLDVSDSVRKASVVNFGEFCKVVGTEATESTLLPEFLNLCVELNNFEIAECCAIRNACADVFPVVSSVLTPETRRKTLPKVFLSLLSDKSRWVRFSAYQKLGHLIFTFADPNRGDIKCNEDGTWTILECNDHMSTYAASNDEQNHETAFCADKNFKTANLLENSLYSEKNSPGGKKNSYKKKTESSFDGLERVSVVEIDEGNQISIDNTVNMNQRLSILKSAEATKSSDCNSSQNAQTSQPKTKQGTYFCHVNDNSDSILLRGEKAVGKCECSLETPLIMSCKNGCLHLHLDQENLFNNFQYWRLPVPEIELDVDVEDGRATSIHVVARARNEKTDEVCLTDVNMRICTSKLQDLSAGDVDSAESNKETSSDSKPVQMLIQTACVNSVASSQTLEQCNLTDVNAIYSSFDEASLTLVDGNITDLKQSHDNLHSPDSKNPLKPANQLLTMKLGESCQDDLSPYDQDIVPPDLLEKYINMVEPALSDTVDSEIARHCAYSLPAVAYTLGRQYWACLRKVCNQLAYNMQWKVRKTVAACLHELGKILGCNLSSEDLVPLFLSLLNDLDEVRLGLLENLADFLKHISPSKRRKLLPQIGEFLKMDNDRNWRFRLVLAEQLVSIIDLYNSDDVEKLHHVTMHLVKDKVWEVRRAAIKLFAVSVLKLADNQESMNFLLNKLSKTFLQSNKWLWRQMYILLSQQLAQENSLSFEMYHARIVPDMLSLVYDPVPNVRLALARCFTETLMPLGYLSGLEMELQDLLTQVICLLHEDVDRDVRYFSQTLPKVTKIEPIPNGETSSKN